MSPNSLKSITRTKGNRKNCIFFSKLKLPIHRGMSGSGFISFFFVCFFSGTQERFHMSPQEFKYDTPFRKCRPGKRFSLEEKSGSCIQVRFFMCVH